MKQWQGLKGLGLKETKLKQLTSKQQFNKPLLKTIL
jgi:hypothetical protein